MPGDLPDYEKKSSVASIGTPIPSVSAVSPLIPGGRMVLYDDFEDTPLKWASAGTGSIARDANYPYSGGACMLLTSGATSGNQIYASRKFSRLLNEKIGFELWAYIPDEDVKLVDIAIELYDGTYLNDPEVYYDFTTEKWYYRDSDRNWVALHTAAKPWELTAYHHIKFTVNHEDRKYGYLVWGRDRFAMHTYTTPRTADAGDPHFYVQVAIRTNENAAKKLYVDDSFITFYEEMEIGGV